MSSEQFEVSLEAARNGDPAAIEELVSRYEPKVRIVARVILGRALRPYVDSIDLVQSVHRSLMVGMRQKKYYLTTPEQLVALAITLVRRKVARLWRRTQRQTRLSGGPLDAASLEDQLASLCDVRTDPAEAVQFQDQLERMCRKLDETERKMLELRLQGLNATEVGRELGLHAVAIRVRWMRLRRRLTENGVITDWL